MCIIDNTFLWLLYDIYSILELEETFKKFCGRGDDNNSNLETMVDLP